MSDNPYQSPTETDKPAAEGKPSSSSWIVKVLVLLAILVVLVALCLPAVRTAREPARRMSCQNNLKQIALALHQYENEYGVLPPARMVDGDGQPLHSWRTLILPYLEQQALYDKIDLSKPWNDPANREAYETIVPTYHCPSAEFSPTHTAYCAVVGPEACFRATRPRALSEITDGRERTLMVVEVDNQHHTHWMSPVDIDPPTILSWQEATGFPHPGIFLAACVDGSVRQLTSNVSKTTLQALISIAGNDDPGAEEEF